MKALLNFRFWVQLFFFGYIYSFFIRKVQFITADLGRHIKNGLLVRDSFDLLFTNFYSYTMPDFMFINHHWGAGFLFSFLWEWGGFVWLGAVYSTILITSFWLFFRIVFY